ncbi:MAG: type II secretion system protein GspD [Phycisphaerae bacterium]
MDDLQVSFLIEATQAHSDTKTLNAPKVAVLNGERASIRVGQQISFVSDYDFETITGATGGGETSLVTSIADPQIDTIRDGVSLTVSPTITSDKKYVILGIETNYFKTSFDTYAVPSDADEAQGATYNIQLPVRSETSIGTRVTVPDGGTLLIGGQKLTGENTQERGVPILSKVPFFGPLFETRGNAKDHHVLLILVKPTIILRDEQEKEAVDAMSSGL